MGRGLPKYAAHRDKYEPEIVKAFREGGATVLYLSIPDAPDLLVGYCGVDHLVEAKTHNAMPSEDQAKWHKAWRGRPVEVIRTAAHARKALRMWTLEAAARAQAVAKADDDLDPLPDVAGKNEEEPA